MLKVLSAIAAAAIIAAVLTLPPVAEPVRAQSAELAVRPTLSDAGCERAWPYPRCAEGRLPAQTIRVITVDRLPDLRPIREASAR